MRDNVKWVKRPLFSQKSLRVDRTPFFSKKKSRKLLLFNIKNSQDLEKRVHEPMGPPYVHTHIRIYIYICISIYVDIWAQ